MGKVGNRVRLNIERPPRDLVEKFREASPPDLAGAMNHTGGMRDIYPMYTPIPKCVGTAITVKVQPGDALMVMEAQEIAQPGDVIVVDGRGVVTRSLWGGNRSILGARKGQAGAIIDGACRDTHESKAANFPVFARAICPMGSDHSQTGELNYPIACGGVVVNPGDIIVADEQGIVVIPWQDAEDVYAAWLKLMERERAKQASSAAGKQVGPNLEQKLRDLGCEIN
ncbi:MAG: RraA family protein [Chloroflexota bacterium]|jgi:4-hydroxy-4-methyl-2-oxoglutarate aldolase